MDPRRVVRYDIAELAKPETDANGFRIFEARVARTGVQKYVGPDGKEHGELRMREDVEASRSTFRFVPITNDHPVEMVNPDNVDKYAVGSVGEELTWDGDWLKTRFVVHTKEANDAIISGRRQMSCGYACDLVPAPLGAVWEGEPYHFMQKNIVGNHIALVDEARAGAGAHLRLDGNSCSVVVSKPPTPDEHKESRPMQLKIDGLTLELNDANAATIQQAIDKLQTRADSAPRVAKRIVSVRSAVDKLRARHDAAMAKMSACDACDGKGMFGEKSCDYCDGAGKFRMHEKFGDADPDEDDEDLEEMEDAVTELEAEQATEEESKKANADAASRREAHRAKVAAARKDSAVRREKAARAREIGEERRALARVDARVELAVEARKHLGASFKIDGLTDDQVKRAVVAKILPSMKLDGRSRDYVDAGYAAAVAQAPKTIDQARASVAPPPVFPGMAPVAAPAGETRADRSDDPREARALMIARKHAAGGRK